MLILAYPCTGCVAYGMGCVVVSVAPPSQPGPMVMAAPPSPLPFLSLPLAPCSGCVAYGMGCVVVSLAPLSQPGPMAMAAPPLPLLFLSLLLAPLFALFFLMFPLTVPHP